MKIGELAERACVPAKTIRYYEEIGLINLPARADNGYRSYADDDVHILQFVNQARRLGLSVNDCRALLTLYRDKSRASSEVKSLAMSHIEEIDRKLTELQSIRHTLSLLAEKCHGDDRPDCPIIEELSNATLKGK